MSNVIHLSEQNFEAEVLRSPVPFFVDFYASWCQPCRMIAPMLEELAGEMIGTAKVGKVNVEESPQLAAAYAVGAVPTLIVFKNGQVVETLTGLQPKKRLMEAIGRYS